MMGKNIFLFIRLKIPTGVYPALGGAGMTGIIYLVFLNINISLDVYSLLKWANNRPRISGLS